MKYNCVKGVTNTLHCQIWNIVAPKVSLSWDSAQLNEIAYHFSKAGIEENNQQTVPSLWESIFE
ncbi:hypothetical protein RCC89_14355 [Cytophagaceae bacterium ABcell3]|nr:hypothetical protein RCC89_14355 [Cytophagaceae bacterium ABcell3]